MTKAFAIATKEIFLVINGNSLKYEYICLKPAFWYPFMYFKFSFKWMSVELGHILHADKTKIIQIIQKLN